MDCLLHTKEFNFDGDETPHDQMHFLMGEFEKGAECDCLNAHGDVKLLSLAITDLIACEQNPHIALYLYTEAVQSDLRHVANQINSALSQIKLHKAGHVKPCGCFEFIRLS